MATITVYPPSSPTNIYHLKQADGTLSCHEDVMRWLIPRLALSFLLAEPNGVVVKRTQIVFDPADGGEDESDLLAKIESEMLDKKFATQWGLPRAIFKTSEGGAEIDEDDVENEEARDEEESKDEASGQDEESVEVESDGEDSDEEGPMDHEAHTEDAVMEDSSLDEHTVHRSDQSGQGKEDEAGQPAKPEFAALAFRYKPAKLRLKLIVRNPRKG